tara:strand:+ start:3727 stop:5154 length:1428 start_codon:yes stop_codon:yes gene_type:complete
MEYLYWNSSQLIQAYNKKELSPVEVIKSSINRARKIQPTCNAITEYFEEKAINMAKEAELSYLGKTDKPRLLEGIPLAVKEEFALEGSYRTSASFIYKNRIDNFTDVYIKRLLNGGCIPVFKTATPEFCLLGTTWSDLHGVTTNPWNNKYTPGGSSGGSGVALATGSCTIASGSDIGGSIRIPAAACGVFGYKPPYGRNPEVPYGNLDYYSHSGPMARSVDDIILMQSLTAGLNNQDIASLPKPSNFDGNFDLQNIKIAWSDHLCGFEVEDEIINNLKNALKVFSDQGAVVEYVDPDLPNNMLDAAGTYLTCLWGTSLKEIAKDKEELLCDYTKKFIEVSKENSLSELVQSNNIAWDAYAKFGPLLNKYDVFICPTNAVTGIPANHGFPNLEYEFNGEIRKTEEAGDESMWLTTPFNMLSRLPVMSAPTGFASNGVPTGMQIVGKAYDDNTVFKVSLGYEKQLNWLFDEQNRPNL